MLPLEGVKVVEFCQVLAGPYCGMLLADMGADVVKIEPPDGDMMRQWPPITDGYSENFASINRNKRSVVLDLKNPEHKAAARRLVLRSDVVLENNRPGVMDRLGLGYESFRKEKPGLVYCSISAFGQSGPRSGEGGFDVTVQAMSGIMSVTGEEGGAPVKCGVPVSDTGTGLYAAFAIVSLLRRVAAGGEGAHIDASMLGCSLGMAALQTSEYFGTGRDPKKLGSAHPRNAPYQAFRAADGHFVIAAGNNKLWQGVTGVVQRPDLFADPRFATTQSRAANQVELKDLLEVEFARHGVDHWLAAFEKAGVPQGRINSYSQVLDDPQVKHMGWVETMELPSGVTTRTFGVPVKISGLDLSKRREPPALGANTKEFLDQSARLRRFIGDMTSLVGGAWQDNDETATVEVGAKLLGELVKNDDWLPDAMAECPPHGYVQNLLWCDPFERFSVVSFVWAPSAKTPVHDHQVWGLVGMLRGSETSQAFVRDEKTGELTTGGCTTLAPGDVEILRPSVGDIHQVTNALSDCGSLSIHVYGGNIGAVRRYTFDPATGKESLFVSGYTNKVVPNLWDRSSEVRAAG